MLNIKYNSFTSAWCPECGGRWAACASPRPGPRWRPARPPCPPGWCWRRPRCSWWEGRTGPRTGTAHCAPGRLAPCCWTSWPGSRDVNVTPRSFTVPKDRRRLLLEPSLYIKRLLELIDELIPGSLLCRAEVGWLQAGAGHSELWPPWPRSARWPGGAATGLWAEYQQCGERGYSLPTGNVLFCPSSLPLWCSHLHNLAAPVETQIDAV